MFLNDSSEFGIHLTEVDTCAICYKVITIYITFRLALKKEKERNRNNFNNIKCFWAHKFNVH